MNDRRSRKSALKILEKPCSCGCGQLISPSNYKACLRCTSQIQKHGDKETNDVNYVTIACWGKNRFCRKCSCPQETASAMKETTTSAKLLQGAGTSFPLGHSPELPCSSTPTKEVSIDCVEPIVTTTEMKSGSPLASPPPPPPLTGCAYEETMMVETEEMSGIVGNDNENDEELRNNLEVGSSVPMRCFFLDCTRDWHGPCEECAPIKHYLHRDGGKKPDRPIFCGVHYDHNRWKHNACNLEPPEAPQCRTQLVAKTTTEQRKGIPPYDRVKKTLNLPSSICDCNRCDIAPPVSDVKWKCCNGVSSRGTHFQCSAVKLYIDCPNNLCWNCYWLEEAENLRHGTTQSAKERVVITTSSMPTAIDTKDPDGDSSSFFRSEVPSKDENSVLCNEQYEASMEIYVSEETPPFPLTATSQCPPAADDVSHKDLTSSSSPLSRPDHYDCDGEVLMRDTVDVDRSGSISTITSSSGSLSKIQHSSSSITEGEHDSRLISAKTTAFDELEGEDFADEGEDEEALLFSWRHQLEQRKDFSPPDIEWKTFKGVAKKMKADPINCVVFGDGRERVYELHSWSQSNVSQPSKECFHERTTSAPFLMIYNWWIGAAIYTRRSLYLSSCMIEHPRYKKGSLVCARVLLSTCNSPILGLVVCNLELLNKYGDSMLQETFKIIRPGTDSKSKGFSRFIAESRMDPSQVYDEKKVEDALFCWLNQTRRLYDQRRGVRHSAPESVWSKSDAQLAMDKKRNLQGKLAGYFFDVDSGELDDDIQKWFRTAQHDLENVNVVVTAVTRPLAVLDEDPKVSFDLQTKPKSISLRSSTTKLTRSISAAWKTVQEVFGDYADEMDMESYLYHAAGIAVGIRKDLASKEKELAKTEAIVKGCNKKEEQQKAKVAKLELQVKELKSQDKEQKREIAKLVQEKEELARKIATMTTGERASAVSQQQQPESPAAIIRKKQSTKRPNSANADRNRDAIKRRSVALQEQAESNDGEMSCDDERSCYSVATTGTKKQRKTVSFSQERNGKMRDEESPSVNDYCATTYDEKATATARQHAANHNASHHHPASSTQRKVFPPRQVVMQRSMMDNFGDDDCDDDVDDNYHNPLLSANANQRTTPQQYQKHRPHHVLYNGNVPSTDCNDASSNISAIAAPARRGKGTCMNTSVSNPTVQCNNVGRSLPRPEEDFSLLPPPPCVPQAKAYQQVGSSYPPQQPFVDDSLVCPPQTMFRMQAGNGYADASNYSARRFQSSDVEELHGFRPNYEDESGQHGGHYYGNQQQQQPRNLYVQQQHRAAALPQGSGHPQHHQYQQQQHQQQYNSQLFVEFEADVPYGAAPHNNYHHQRCYQQQAGSIQRRYRPYP